MKSGHPSRANPAQKKAVHPEKQPARDKVWVNPKSTFKKFCEQAWKRAEVPSPKFIEMSQIDLRRNPPPAQLKVKAAVAGQTGTSSKSRGRREE